MNASEEKARDCGCVVSAQHQSVLLSRRLVIACQIRMVTGETDGTIPYLVSYLTNDLCTRVVTFETEEKRQNEKSRNEAVLWSFFQALIGACDRPCDRPVRKIL